MKSTFPPNIPKPKFRALLSEQKEQGTHKIITARHVANGYNEGLTNKI